MNSLTVTHPEVGMRPTAVTPKETHPVAEADSRNDLSPRALKLVALTLGAAAVFLAVIAYTVLSAYIF
jgi:hypothetical protein